MNGSLFWLLLRYAELVNPNAIVKSAPPVSSSYYYECLRKSGDQRCRRKLRLSRPRPA